MTDSTQFLETEAALNALLNEVRNLKSAAEQIGEASAASRRVTQASEQIAAHAADVLRNSSQMLAKLEEAHLDQRLVGLQTQLGSVQQDSASQFTAMEAKNAARSQALDEKLGALKTLQETIAQTGSATLDEVKKIGKLMRNLLIAAICMSTVTLILAIIQLVRLLSMR